MSLTPFFQNTAVYHGATATNSYIFVRLHNLYLIGNVTIKLSTKANFYLINTGLGSPYKDHSKGFGELCSKSSFFKMIITIIILFRVRVRRYGNERW